MSRFSRYTVAPVALAVLTATGAVQAYPPYDYGPYPGYMPTPQMPPYGPFGVGGPEQRQGLSISRDADADAYYITIATNGIEPKAVQVRTEGRWILIGLDRSQQDSYQDTFDQGRGYVRSYSLSSGQTSKRFTLPRDADPQALRREDGEKQVRVIIPRIKY